MRPEGEIRTVVPVPPPRGERVLRGGEESEHGPEGIDLSVVIPAYEESANLRRLYEELIPVLSSTRLSWEVIIVDDGSRDATWQEISALHERDGRIKGLRLSRNFGHQYALFAGFHAADGRAVVTMDADLQHPPDVIPRLIEKWEEGHRIVNTVREDPEDFTFAKRWSAKAFYALLSFLSGVRIERGMADFRLLDRDVVEQLLAFREEGLFLRGLVQWVGYQGAAVPYQAAPRLGGRSKYTLRKMLRFAWHGITSFSIVPLRVGIGLGVLTSLLSMAYLVRAVYHKVVVGDTVEGWASTVGILSFLFGVLFILLGLVGEYVGRILEQVRRRPLFIVADRVGVESRPQHGAMDPAPTRRSTG